MTTILPLQLLLLLLSTLLSSPANARDSITPGKPLAAGGTLVSSGGAHYALGFFTPPGTNNTYVGIWYNTIAVQTVVWVANRASPITGNSTGGILSVTANGTLVVADGNSTVLWSASPRATLTDPAVRLLDTGNLVIRDAAGAENVAWQSFDHPTDTLLPGMKFGVDFANGINRTLTAWASATDPAPGPLVMMMDVSGDPEVLICNGPDKVWRSGPWDGFQFAGVPDTATYAGFSFSFVDTPQEVTYSFSIEHASIISRLVLNTSGLLQRSVWVESSGSWNVFWYAPKDQCDHVSPCGPYGVCDSNNSPVCACLQGFRPKNPANWALRDGTDGCVRRTPLDCKNGTDGFVAVQHAKVPDSSECFVDRSISLEQCREKCLRNCSCTAYASFNISGGGAGTGCVMWVTELTDLRVYTEFGQELFVRLAAADLGSTTSKSKRNLATIALIVSLLGLAILLVLAFAGLFIWRRKKAKKPGLSTSAGSCSTEHHRVGSSRDHDLELPLFDLETIASATEGFSSTNKLGEGGFGPVYKGKLADGQEIAVKALSKTSIQGIDEFKNEVLLIAKLQHRNLVRLLGCCICGEEKMLVYEYMANKSLDYFLFEKSNSALLDWQTRYHIIEGIARGLVYLHQDSRYRIIHRDLKASNVLLDKEMNPKISDFGMARMFGGDETEINTRRVVGTYGYMSPEYAMDGVFSMKSDVFSFGVLVLEIVSGRRNRGAYSYSNHLNLLAHAWSLWNEGKSLQLVDESMNDSFDSEEVLKCLKLGLLCGQENPEDRPLMSSAILMLASDSSSLPNPRVPGFAARRALLDTDSSSHKPDSSILDNLTGTMIEGR